MVEIGDVGFVIRTFTDCALIEPEEVQLYWFGHGDTVVKSSKGEYHILKSGEFFSPKEGRYTGVKLSVN